MTLVGIVKTILELVASWVMHHASNCSFIIKLFFSNQSFSTTIRVSFNFDPDQAQRFVFTLFAHVSVNSYGHDETVSSPNFFFLGKLDEAVNQYFMHILSLEQQPLNHRKEMNDSRNYIMINLHESMGLGSD